MQNAKNLFPIRYECSGRKNSHIFTLWPHSFLHTYVHLLVNWHCFSEIRSGRQRRWWIAGKTKNKRGHRFNGRCSHYRTDGGHYTYRFSAARLWGIVSQILTFPWSIEYLIFDIYFRIFSTLGKYNSKQVLLMIAENPAYGLANLHGPWVKPRLSNTLCRIQGFWIQKVQHIITPLEVSTSNKGSFPTLQEQETKS